MSNKKDFTVPTSKNIKAKRPSMCGPGLIAPSQSKVSVIRKEKTESSQQKSSRNTTICSAADVIIPKQAASDLSAEFRQIEYGKFLRAMLEQCLVNEKIEKEETEMDLQITELTERLKKTIDQLDKTNRRVKEVTFVVEQKRLIDLKKQDCLEFYDTTAKTNVQESLSDLLSAEEICLNKLNTKNVDFGYNKENGHQQLLEAVNDGIEGLEQLKIHSNLNLEKFKEYKQTQHFINELEKDRFTIENLKTEFEKKFPMFSEKLLKHVSSNIADMIDSSDED